MATEFEQTKRDVSGRSVMITSWFDEREQGWHASAPNYNTVGAQTSKPGKEISRSRQAAIDQVAHLLSRHFETTPTRSSEKIIFI